MYCQLYKHLLTILLISVNLVIETANYIVSMTSFKWHKTGNKTVNRNCPSNRPFRKLTTCHQYLDTFPNKLRVHISFVILAVHHTLQIRRIRIVQSLGLCVLRCVT